jgi:hypothetical protein
MDSKSSNVASQIRDQTLKLLLLLLVLQLSVSCGLLNNSLPCFSIHRHLTQFWVFIFSRFALTSSSHLHLGLPILLTAIGLRSVILYTLLSLPIFTIFPTHLILCAFIYLTIPVCLISNYISSLVFILQLPSWLFIGLYIFLITCLSNTLHCYTTVYWTLWIAQHVSGCSHAPAQQPAITKVRCHMLGPSV